MKNENRIKELREERHKLTEERIEILTTTMRMALSNKMIKLFQAKVECIDRNIKKINEELYEIDPEEKEKVDSKNKNEEDVKE